MLLLVAACGAQPAAAPRETPTPSPTARSTALPHADTDGQHRRPTPKSTPTPAPSPTEHADPRWRFYSQDRTRHTSPWFAGAHRVMIGYGCNASPWYDHDSRCPGRQGFHHGIDVAMPCGTPLFSAVDGVVLEPVVEWDSRCGVRREPVPDPHLVVRHLDRAHPPRLRAARRQGAPGSADRARLRQRRTGRVSPALRGAHPRRWVQRRRRPGSSSPALLIRLHCRIVRDETVVSCPNCRRDRLGLSRPGRIAAQALWRRNPKVRLSLSAIQDASITLWPTPTVTHELSPSEVSISTRVIASVPCPWSRMRTL